MMEEIRDALDEGRFADYKRCVWKDLQPESRNNTTVSEL